ncbi:MAG TPA: enoyl-CoA hydratase-related protein [Pyrinomonadaceae bacterium]|nr:enoyl-CoA hydratase-related protein [Pyrinomonadaceae bacterium]
MSFIELERKDGVAVVRLNRPEKLNSLTGEMILSLTDLFRGFAADPSLRAVILTGAGEKAFCVGTDIGELVDRSEAEALNISKRGQSLCNLIERSPVPVIAAINGLAVGGGCELALACHMRLATANASFSLPETRLGIVPGYGGTQRMPREVGMSRALELMLAGREVSSADAERLGLINRVLEAASLLQEAESLAQDIARLAPLAIRACLESVRVGSELPLDEGLAVEARLFAALFETADMREGTRAFLEKRKPVFKGT